LYFLKVNKNLLFLAGFFLTKENKKTPVSLLTGVDDYEIRKAP